MSRLIPIISRQTKHTPLPKIISIHQRMDTHPPQTDEGIVFKLFFARRNRYSTHEDHFDSPTDGWRPACRRIRITQFKLLFAGRNILHSRRSFRFSNGWIPFHGYESPDSNYSSLMHTQLPEDHFDSPTDGYESPADEYESPDSNYSSPDEIYTTLKIISIHQQMDTHPTDGYESPDKLFFAG